MSVDMFNEGSTLLMKWIKASNQIKEATWCSGVKKQVCLVVFDHPFLRNVFCFNILICNTK
jgi:hypothetical protein